MDDSKNTVFQAQWNGCTQDELTETQTAHTGPTHRVPALKWGCGHELPSPPKKLSPLDNCLQRKNPFSLTVSLLRAGPVPGSQQTTRKELSGVFVDFLCLMLICLGIFVCVCVLASLLLLYYGFQFCILMVCVCLYVYCVPVCLGIYPL